MPSGVPALVEVDTVPSCPFRIFVDESVASFEMNLIVLFVLPKIFCPDAHAGVGALLQIRGNLFPCDEFAYHIHLYHTDIDLPTVVFGGTVVVTGFMPIMKKR